jgi:RNA-dependent RNA polymerase
MNGNTRRGRTAHTVNRQATVTKEFISQAAPQIIGVGGTIIKNLKKKYNLPLLEVVGSQVRLQGDTDSVVEAYKEIIARVDDSPVEITAIDTSKLPDISLTVHFEQLNTLDLTFFKPIDYHIDNMMVVRPSSTTQDTINVEKTRENIVDLYKSTFGREMLLRVLQNCTSMDVHKPAQRASIEGYIGRQLFSNKGSQSMQLFMRGTPKTTFHKPLTDEFVSAFRECMEKNNYTLQVEHRLLFYFSSNGDENRMELLYDTNAQKLSIFRSGGGKIGVKKRTSVKTCMVFIRPHVNLIDSTQCDTRYKIGIYDKIPNVQFIQQEIEKIQVNPENFTFTYNSDVVQLGSTHWIHVYKYSSTNHDIEYCLHHYVRENKSEEYNLVLNHKMLADIKQGDDCSRFPEYLDQLTESCFGIQYCDGIVSVSQPKRVSTEQEIVTRSATTVKKNKPREQRESVQQAPVRHQRAVLRTSSNNNEISDELKEAVTLMEAQVLDAKELEDDVKLMEEDDSMVENTNRTKEELGWEKEEITPNPKVAVKTAQARKSLTLQSKQERSHQSPLQKRENRKPQVHKHKQLPTYTPTKQPSIVTSTESNNGYKFGAIQLCVETLKYIVPCRKIVIGREDIENIKIDFDEKNSLLRCEIQRNNGIRDRPDVFLLQFTYDNINDCIIDRGQSLFVLKLKVPPRILQKRYLDGSLKYSSEIEGRREWYQIATLLDKHTRLWMGRCMVYSFKCSLEFLDQLLAEKRIRVQEQQVLFQIRTDVYIEQSYFVPRVLEDNVYYKFHVAISNGILDTIDFDGTFFNSLNDYSSEEIERGLELLIRKGFRILDPTTALRQAIQDSRLVVKREVPPNCVMIRHVYVTPTRIVCVGPEIDATNRALRLYPANQNDFLRVSFTDENLSKLYPSYYDLDGVIEHIKATFQSKFTLGDRGFRLLLTSSSQLKQHSCWFLRFHTSIHNPEQAQANVIRDRLGDFSSCKTASKFCARIGQCFSHTQETITIDDSEWEEMPDVERNGYCFTDGVGTISTDLMKRVEESLGKYNLSAIQIRFAGYKGVVSLDPTLHGSLLRLRPSMRKFVSDHRMLEVVSANKFGTYIFNRQVITLLKTLCVPDNAFIHLQDRFVKDLSKMQRIVKTAKWVLSKYPESTSSWALELIEGGVALNDPFLHGILHSIYLRRIKDLREKTRIPVGFGASLMGISDETQTLQEGQVYVKTSKHELITGPVVVTKNPCLHPGDVLQLEAVDAPQLSHLCDVIVFPQLGNRPHPNETSGSDLDGDIYSVLWHKNLIPEYEEPPADYSTTVTVTKATDTPWEDVPNFFSEFIRNDVLGSVATSWLSFADTDTRFALNKNCLKLAALHSSAVDYVKSGVPAIQPPRLRCRTVPHYMVNSRKPKHNSTSVIGIMFDKAMKIDDNQDSDMITQRTVITRIDDDAKYIQVATQMKHQYEWDVCGLMRQFGVATEFEIISGNVLEYGSHIKLDLHDVSIKVASMYHYIKKKYEKMFDEVLGDDASDHERECLAAACYHVTTEQDMTSFPWIFYKYLLPRIA